MNGETLMAMIIAVILSIIVSIFLIIVIPILARAQNTPPSNADVTMIGHEVCIFIHDDVLKRVSYKI